MIPFTYLTRFLFLILWITDLHNSLCAQQNLQQQFFFRTGSAELNPGEEIKWQDFLKTIDTLNISSISISGWCDDRGSENYNKQLSLKRASYLAQSLKEAGITNTNIVINGNGEVAARQTTTANLQQERSENRKVEIQIRYAPKTTTVPVVVANVYSKSIFSDHHKVGDKITLSNILFSGGTHRFLPESYPSLDSLVHTLQVKKQYHILILGHICCSPPGKDGEDMETGRMDLSVARARAVYDYLIKSGVRAERLDYKGMKGDYPTGKDSKYDRRVEIEITKQEE